MNGADGLAAVLYAPKDVRIERLSGGEVPEGQLRVAVEATGLCGSDLHYYADGRNGPNTVTAPVVLGHEGAGLVSEVGVGVDPALRGQRVAIELAVPCGRCRLCRGGSYHLCPHGSCLGSPPTHGTMRGSVVVPVANAHPVNRLDGPAAALVEPLAVATWAVHRAGIGLGTRVLVTGAGPIGQLAAVAARLSGACWLGLVDPEPARLASAAGLADGYFPTLAETPPDTADVLLECSGAPEALAGLRSVRAGGRIALVGTPAHRPPPAEVLVRAQRYELDVRGCFRYGPGAFASAARLADSGRVDLNRLVTASYPLTEAGTALRTALTDRGQLKTVVLAAPAATGADQ